MKKYLFINGKRIEATEYRLLHSPYSGEVIADIPVATAEETELAIQAAEKAKEVLRKMPAYKRAEILENLACLLEEKHEEAANIITLESAKPIKLARDEVSRTVQTYKFAAEEAKRIQGETIPLDAAPGGEDRIAYTVHEPIGIIGAITPFNFPMNLVAHKVGPAIATGNTIVLKPANQTPLSALFIAELFSEAGLPAGVLNVVIGNGSLIGDQIVRDPRINMITFTGSPEIGIAISNKVGLKRLTLELGSNAALIVDKNIDIDKIIERCIMGSFSNQGQVCISLQRIYVHNEIYHDFVNKFTEAVEKLVFGNPFDEKVDLSALISPDDVERAVSWINEARDEGALIVTGGKTTGNILHPTTILGANRNLKVSCREVFAPIVLINEINSVEEGINLINDSRYGLQAGIYTENISTALEAAEELDVGGVIINDVPTFRVDNMPYGGVKDSGVGREGIKYAVSEMTETKLVIWNKN
ncbi:aldehyde dehydrogenase family protein [Sporosarcina sp. Marseille-Q4063]|uniref:aldehyde dehydrogenase family protein n=1 Tax=Sporosarcina sp. Marseille-Q4063 TaxID=2810514 RepID=UPI001BB044B2|nr:aldehyde dehydrogenase family protein [Sporosarcina sp. Marseille-Q4063]QUW21282.1 aldehyde dehydrogenase family protein [Sporosarcina sp. Marseille-Q4063]